MRSGRGSRPALIWRYRNCGGGLSARIAGGRWSWQSAGREPWHPITPDRVTLSPSICAAQTCHPFGNHQFI